MNINQPAETKKSEKEFGPRDVLNFKISPLLNGTKKILIGTLRSISTSNYLHDFVRCFRMD